MNLSPSILATGYCYRRVMESDEKLEHGEIFDEIVRRRKKKDDAKANKASG